MLAPGRSARVLVACAAATALALALASCTSSPQASAGASAGSTGGASTSPSPTPTPTLVIAASLPFNQNASFTVAQGSLEEATVTGKLHGTPLVGEVEPGGTSWTSSELPVAGAAYDVTAVVKDATGSEHTLTGALQIAAIPPHSKLGYDITPSNIKIVGVNAPIVIRFHQAITDRKAVEENLVVTTSVPVVGSWHWVSASEVHFRPKNPWPTNTVVDLAANLNHVQVGPTLWGANDAHVRFTVGAARVTRVNGQTETLTVTENGRTVASWPTSLGKPEFATRSGTYIVLSKNSSLQMTSCSASITCDKNNANYYDLKVDWDVRLSWSGTFVHAAPWSVAHQGKENVSHGCINLSEANGETYFNAARYGDPVIVTGTSRTAADLVAAQDPGMDDWNVSWGTYVAASALGSEITTGSLA